MSTKERDLLDSSVNRKYIISGVAKLIGVLFTITSAVSALYFHQLTATVNKVYENQQYIISELKSNKEAIGEFKDKFNKQEELNKEYNKRLSSLELGVQSLDIRFGIRDNTKTFADGSRKLFQ